jgi:hypothetical protein
MAVKALAVFLILLLLAWVNAGFGLAYVGGFVLFGLVLMMAILVSAFRTSLLQGLLTLFVPFYFLVYVYGLSKDPRLKVLTPLPLLLLIGTLFLPGGEIVRETTSGGRAGSTGSGGGWSYQGASYSLARALARRDDASAKPGLTVILLDEPTRPGEPFFRKNHAEVFFPRAGAGYGRPTSVTITTAQSHQVSAGRMSGFDGGIESVNPQTKRVVGWVKADELGFDSSGSIDVRFEAELSN